MKCPECGGYGKVGKYNYYGTCPQCGGTGEVETTEQEWLQTCNTEQLAEKLTDFSFWLVPTIPTEDKREQTRKKIELWLKEIHDEM